MRLSNTYRGARRNSAKAWRLKTKPRMSWKDAWNLTQKAAAMQLSHQRRHGK